MNHIRLIINEILRRKHFKVTIREIFMNFIIEHLCCRKKVCVSNKTYDRYKIIDRTSQMLENKLDIIELLKSTFLSKILLSAILTPEQRLLLLYQRKKVVEHRLS